MYGLNIPKKDRRRFSYKKYFGASFMPPLVDFMVKPLEIKDQGSSDMCVAYATSSSSEKQEGIPLEPAYLFAKTKQLMGNWQEWGSDPVKAMKACCEYGGLEKTVSPYSLEKNGRNFVANWANWDKTLDLAAQIHKKKSYFSLDAGKDIYDSIVIGLYDNRNNQMTAVVGVYWQPEWTYLPSGIIRKYGTNKNLPHAIEVIGQKIIDGEPFLIIQNSWGDKVGDNGLYYMNREVANNFLFQFAIIDTSPEDVKAVTWGVLEYVKDILVKILNMFKTPEIKQVVETNTNTVMPIENVRESKLEVFAKAIQEHEGWFNGSRSYRNNNPGNLKFTTYTKSLGAIGKDNLNFCKFADYKSGFSALCRFVQDASNNQLKSYHDCTIKTFFLSYAPSYDMNDPLAYAMAVAEKVGVKIDTRLSDII